MNFQCPKCGYVFHEQYRYCPHCGNYIKYKENNWNAINNWQANGWERFNHGLNDANQKMNGNSSGCGCFAIVGFIIFIILLFAII